MKITHLQYLHARRRSDSVLLGRILSSSRGFR